MAVVPYPSSSSSSSSSSVPNSCKHDVFISFRGEVRKNFVSHLHAALEGNGILTYIDEKSLERGEEISPALLTAIEESQLSLVVFSKDYASSRWCLDELVHILKCKKKNSQIVIPVFYYVKPSDIRHRKPSYRDAFVSHRKRFKHDKNKVEVWRNALKEAADLCGFELKDESECEFVKKIVKDVQKKLEAISSSTAPNYLQGLVGMSKRLAKVESLLCVGSPTVRVIGICGMGGLGKTTLAKALYKKLSTQFDSCFFTDVKEDASKQGLNSLREKLFCKLLKRDIVSMESPYKDVQLRRIKALVVFDNVDDPRQLQNLLEKDLLGVGSRIIVTSRDRKLLERNEIYDVVVLEDNEARKLFYMKAFKRDSVVSDYADLVKRVLDYAKGHPLAIEVLGSHLQGRSRKEWESTLSKLTKCPQMEIHDVLKTSYDALDRIQKSIFLDIACFFKEERRDFVEGILGEESHVVINVLIERSLITIKNYDSVSMHDLMQEMGWEIIRHKYPNEPAKHSRLWITQDILHVLKENNGTNSIEGISLDMSEIYEDIYLEPTVFKEMSSLRSLKIYTSTYDYTGTKCSKVYLHGADLCYLPDSLRYLRWDMYLSKTLPSTFRAESLVELEMRGSQLTQLWDEILNLGNLKRIDLDFSKKLIKIPNLSHATRLEIINLKDCTSLVELPPVNFQVPALALTDSRFKAQCLNVSGCHSLENFPEITGNIGYLNLSGTGIIKLPSSIRSCNGLFYLDLSGCKNLEYSPELPRNLGRLNLSRSSIQVMTAASIKCLQCIRKIDMRDCERFESLPDNFYELKSLEELYLGGCSNLKKFPEILEPMTKLRILDLKKTGIEELPSSFQKIIEVSELNVEDCRNLKTIPKCLRQLKFFHCGNLSFSGCSKLKIFPDIFCRFRTLEKLNLCYCNILEIPEWVESLSSLKVLKLKGNMFASIPSSIKQLTGLVQLDISDCRNLQSLPELPLSVRDLIANGCMSIETVSTSSCSMNAGIFMYFGCLNLKQIAYNNIAMNFLCGVIWALMRKETTKIQVCYWGNTIPKWIGHQSEGSSTLTIKLPPNRHNSNISGLVACVVLSIEDLCMCPKFSNHYNEDGDSCVYIGYQLKLAEKHLPRGDNFRSSWNLCDRFLHIDSLDIKDRERRSDHVFMFYDDYNDYSDTVEVSFCFFCECHCGRGECRLRYDVKRIGVHMLYFEKDFAKGHKQSARQYAEYVVGAAENGIDIHEYIRSHHQAASHNVAESEAPPDDNDRNTVASWDSTTIHEETVNRNHFMCSSADSDEFQTDNILENDSDATDNIAEPSATPVPNFDAEESWFEIIKCFVFSGCLRFLDCIIGNREN